MRDNLYIYNMVEGKYVQSDYMERVSLQSDYQNTIYFQYDSKMFSENDTDWWKSCIAWLLYVIYLM